MAFDSDELKTLCQKASEAMQNVANEAELETLRVEYFGKKSHLSQGMRALGNLDADQRREKGAELNRLRDDLLALFESRKADIAEKALGDRMQGEKIDATLSARPFLAGKLHPVNQIIEETIAIFGNMGFRLAEGPQIEDDFHNFTALNIPPGHPARQMQDTFYLPALDGKNGEGKGNGNNSGTAPRVLRTHTSPVQIRTMEAEKPPLYIISPGRTYRSDSDQTHTPMFHQIEGLAIDEKIHFGHLKGCLQEFVSSFFEQSQVPVRFRPSHFPFTEPSAEMDIGCRYEGDLLHIGEGGEWLEILGCGMVHPAVLENCGIDSTRYQGFAFGMGIERIGMLKYGIPDLRQFFENKVDWLSHYGFFPWFQASLASGLSLR